MQKQPELMPSLVHLSTATSITDDPEYHDESPDDQSEDELSADESEVCMSEPDSVVTHPQERSIE